MNYRNLVLSLCLLGGHIVEAKDLNKAYSFQACCKKEKKCCTPTAIWQATTIDKSGPYCLAQDIVGTIVIAADNVTLDLNSHAIDGNQATAIVASNVHNVTIKNGTITNANLGISITNAEGVRLDTIDILASNQAVLLSKCSSSEINAVAAYQNTNTSGAIILVDSSDSIRLTNVQANDNLKNLSASVGPVDPGTAIVCVNKSTNVVLQECAINTNQRINQNCRFSPLGIYSSSKNIQVLNSTINGNYITEDDVRGFSPLIARASFNVVLDGLQVNNNKIKSTSIGDRSIYIVDVPGLIIKNTQVNGNSCGLLNENPGFATDFTGIFIFNVSTGSNDAVISDCQISGNTLDSAGDVGFEGALVGMYINAIGDFAGYEGRSTIENCQITDNIMTSTVVRKFVDGIIITGAADVIVDGVTCNGNSGGEITTGIAIEGFVQYGTRNPARNITVRNSTANNNSANDQAFGIFLGGSVRDDLRTAAENCTLLSCVANNNIGGSNGFGIAFSDAIGCSAINCQTDANSRSGIYAGFIYPTDENPVNTDNSIINCSAKRNGLHGFEFSSTSTNDNFLVQDCVALANNNTGFLHENDILTSRFLGNYAKGNGTDYSIAGGEIQLFSLDINGTYSHITGDVDHFSALVNVEG